MEQTGVELKEKEYLLEKKDSKTKNKHWQIELELAQKERSRSKWLKETERAVKRFQADDTTGLDDDQYGGQQRVARVDWSNAQMLRASLYVEAPLPLVKRRRETKDPIARLAAHILEDATAYSMAEDQEFNDVAASVVFDFLTSSRGIARERFVPEYEEVTETVEATWDPELGVFTNPDGEEVKEEDLSVDANGTTTTEISYEKLVRAKSVTEYVHYKDFLHSPARTWEEVTWVAFRSYLTRREFRERFSNVPLHEVNFGTKPAGLEKIASAENEQREYEKAEVWEVWDKVTKTVFWVSSGYKEGLLDEKEDIYQLKGFFPVPKPMVMMSSNENLYPTPMSTYTKDQLNEIDDFTDRINAVMDGVRVTGVCNGPFADTINRMMETDNSLIGLDNWASFSESGAFAGQMAFMPIETHGNVLSILLRGRAESKSLYDEISGMSDIVRGETNPNETAAAQNIKSEFANRRFELWRSEVNRFLRDIVRIKAELIAEQYTPELLWQIADVESYMSPPDQGAFMQAAELLQNEDIRCYKIEIETDHTAFKDTEAEKHRRNEMLMAVSDFLPRFIEMGKAFPEYNPPLTELLLFVIRTYRPGKHFEEMFEQASQAAIEAQQQAMQQPPPPDPAMIKVEQEGKLKELEINQQASESQVDAQIKMGDLEIKRERVNVSRFKAEADANLRAMEIQLKYNSPAPQVVAAEPEKKKIKRMIPQRDPQTGQLVAADIIEVEIE